MGPPTRKLLQAARLLLHQSNSGARALSSSSASHAPMPGCGHKSIQQDVTQGVQQHDLQQTQLRGNAALAQQAVKVAVPTFVMPNIPVPAVKVGTSGAISVVPEGERIEEGVYKNLVSLYLACPRGSPASQAPITGVSSVYCYQPGMPGLCLPAGWAPL
jgi:hypothetical protein